MIHILEITATDAGLYAAAVVVIMGGFFAGVVKIIDAIKGTADVTNQKLDTAATRREQIGTAVIDPGVTVLPPKETP